MTIGTSLFLIAVGAILKYAVIAHVAGINVHMVVGVVGLVIGIFLMFRAATMSLLLLRSEES